jgi:hypothetical protein
VPSAVEWKGLIDVGGWGSNGANMHTALLLPYAGYRNYSNASVESLGSNGSYSSSSPHTTPNAYALSFGSSYLGLPSNYRGFGFAIRCFKN